MNLFHKKTKTTEDEITEESRENEEPLEDEKASGEDEEKPEKDEKESEVDEEESEEDEEESEEDEEESEEDEEESEEDEEESDEDEEESEEDEEESEEDKEESDEDEEESEDDEEFDEDEEENVQHVQTKHHRGRRDGHTARKVFKALGITCGVIVALAVVVYLGFAIYFNSHFLFYTTINGVDFSLKSVSQVEEYMSQQVADYTLTLEESDGQMEVIKGSDISAQYVPGDQLNELVKAQNVFLWPDSLVHHPEIETSVGVTYDEEALNDVISTLNCVQEDNQYPSENAVPVFQLSEYVVQPEVIGTELKTEEFTQAVATAVNGFQDELNLKDADCYVQPEYVSNSPEVLEAADKMNAYLSAQITYDMSPDKVVVGASEISQWLKVDQATMDVSLKQGSVKEFISDLASQYDTYGHDREFTTATGRTVTVKGGSYGWKIDQDEETEALISDIENGTVVEREPAYSHKAVTHGENDLGSTYAEVDLTNQHMYYTKDGAVVLDSDVVTGNPNKGNGTPQGTYSIMYKETNAVLRGTRRSDGSYEYETPVAYWMPFNGGIGFHDATWQSSFGGDRYLSHGSHGCVNMPKSKAEELYSLISTGDPVVCYY